MTHCSTANQAKNKHATPLRDAPRPGTKTREIYDLFMASRGQPIQFMVYKPKDGIFHYRKVEYLRDTYGLDIRRLRNGLWVLAGEWVGKGYIDYIVERKET